MMGDPGEGHSTGNESCSAGWYVCLQVDAYLLTEGRAACLMIST